MRIEYRPATACPAGQFVVYAENQTDLLMLKAFFSADQACWKWQLHGRTWGGRPGEFSQQSFNFGWAKRPKKKWWQRK